MLCDIFKCPVYKICLGYGFKVMNYTVMNYLDYVRKLSAASSFPSVITKSAFEPNESIDAGQLMIQRGQSEIVVRSPVPL